MGESVNPSVRLGRLLTGRSRDNFWKLQGCNFVNRFARVKKVMQGMMRRCMALFWAGQEATKRRAPIGLLKSSLHQQGAAPEIDQQSNADQ
jgi:hypothetical protein